MLWGSGAQNSTDVSSKNSPATNRRPVSSGVGVLVLVLVVVELGVVVVLVAGEAHVDVSRLFGV